MKKVKSSSASDILERIDRRMSALKEAGEKVSYRSISKAATGSEFTLASIRKGILNGSQRGISTETLNQLAPVLRTTVEWLHRAAGAEEVKPDGFHLDSQDVLGAGADRAATVPLLGYVRAGAEAVYLPLHENELDRIPAPPGTTDKTRALEIRGDSLGELFDRWIVFFDDEQRPINPDLVNKLCIVALTDGRVLVKKIRRAAGGAGYDLLSNTEKPIKNAPIRWAARVKHMAPR